MAKDEDTEDTADTYLPHPPYSEADDVPVVDVHAEPPTHAPAEHAEHDKHTKKGD